METPQPPQPPQSPPGEPPLMPSEPPAAGPALRGPVGVPAGRGLSWLTEAWGYFSNNPLVWVALVIVLFVIQLALGLIPLLGPLAQILLSPIFAGGLMLGCKAIDEGGTIQFNHLFAAFDQYAGKLALVGAIYLGALIVAMLAAGVLAMVLGMGGGLMAGLSSMGDPDVGGAVATGAAATGMLIFMLLMLAVMLPVIMAYYFAPVLVVMHGLEPLEAMKLSFSGCLKNVVPFLLYGIAVMVAGIIAAIPLGLGFLVLMPMIIASMYIAYKDIYLAV